MIRVGTLKFLLQIAYKFSQLCGLVPFHYSEGSSSYVSGWYDQIWPATAYLSFAYFYPTSGLSVISVLNPLVVVAFFYMTVTTISVIFLVQAINARKICTLLNDIAALNSELFKREQNLVGKSYWPYVSLALAKIILVNFVAQCAVIYCCTTLAIMLTGKGDFFVVFLISWAYCLQTIVPNMFYVGVLGASFHYEQINKEIAVVLREAKLLSFGQHDFTSNELKEKFLELSGRLNCLASLHSRLFHLVTRANETCSLQLLVSTANFVGILLIEVSICFSFTIFTMLMIVLIELSDIFRLSVHRRIFSHQPTGECVAHALHFDILWSYFHGAIHVEHGLFTGQK